MGIEETTTFVVKCDMCTKSLKKFKSEREAVLFAGRVGWHITSTGVQCPECKVYPLPKEAK